VHHFTDVKIAYEDCFYVCLLGGVIEKNAFVVQAEIRMVGARGERDRFFVRSPKR
jgi:hypothetical protein